MDIRRASGSYTPTPRDDAAMFRGHLMQSVASQNAREAEAVLLSILSASELRDHRDYILHLLDEVSRSLADGEAWPAGNVRYFESQHLAKPVSAAELFALACRRLRQIKTEVEQPFDLNVAESVTEQSDEATVRRFLALRLTQLSRGIYTAPQEAVIAKELRPDLRIECGSITAAVPIEVKLADDRSVNDLLSDLRDQLAVDYLSNHQSRRGLFVVGFVGGRGSDYWIHPTDHSKLKFAEVIEHLSVGAKAILKEDPLAMALVFHSGMDDG